MSRIVVVGAGVGGLAAAARLAVAGHEVTVCEQAEIVGGKLGWHTQDGFSWDTGPSLLTMPQILEDLFTATGAPLAQSLQLRRLDPIARYRFADGVSFDAAADPDEMCGRLDAALGPGSGDDWHRLLQRAEAMWRAVEEPFLRSPLDGVRTLARLATSRHDVGTVAPHRTLRGLGRQYLRDPRLRLLLERYATYSGSDPRRAPATLAVIAYIEQAFGAWYVEGGLYRIAEALLERVLEHGVDVRTSTDVASIHLEQGRVAAVRLTDGSNVRCDLVVANADAQHVYRDLLPRGSAVASLRRLHRATPSLSGFVVLLGVRSSTARPAHHTVLFGSDYDAEFDAIFSRRPGPAADPTLYLAVPDDPALAPPGTESWFLLVNAARQGAVDWRARSMVEAYADHLIGLLGARGHDLADRIVTRTVISPADLQARTRTPAGSIYGTSSNGPRSAFLRPANTSPVPGLFLVGGSSHPGGGLPLVLLSAQIVARAIGRAD